MIIRPFNSSDAATFYKWYHDKRLEHFYRGFIYGASLEQCANAVGLLKGHIHLGLNSENKAPMGAVTLADKDRVLRIYKLGLLVDPEYQNKEVGKELLAFGVKWAFDTMNAHKIVADVMAGDHRTVKGVAKAGFIFDGTTRQSIFMDGKFHNELNFSMLREDYERVKNGQHNGDGTKSNDSTAIAAAAW